MKRDGRTLDHWTLEEIRRMAVERVRSGEEPSVVIASYGFCRTTIYKWLRATEGRGRELDALRSRKGTGRPPKLTKSQQQQVFRWINGNDPRQYGYDLGFWTRKVVSDLVSDRIGIQLSLTSVGRVLANVGLTPQRPQIRHDRDEVAIEVWKRADNSVFQRARRRHAYIVFVDEAGFMLAPLRRRTWAPRGQTPMIEISEPHGRISVVGAITISPFRRHFGFHFDLLADNTNFRGDSVARFIEQIHRHINAPITLIWDSIPIHSANPVRAFLASHRKTVVEPFPLYAPELNPVDNLWGYVKYDRLANCTLRNLDELRKTVTVELRRLQRRSDLLESFCKRAHLILDRN
jgi:transposase